MEARLCMGKKCKISGGNIFERIATSLVLCSKHTEIFYIAAEQILTTSVISLSQVILPGACLEAVFISIPPPPLILGKDSIFCNKNLL